MSAAPEVRRSVCIVTHVCRKNDGQGRVNYEIALCALAAGWRVTILSAELAPDLAASPFLLWVRLEASRIPSNLLKYQVFAWKSAQWLRQHGHEYDVVHANGFITWEKAHINTAHFVHAGWRHSGYFPYRWHGGPRQAYQCLFTALNARFEKRAFQQADQVIAVSSKIADELAATDISATKIRVIPNGVDLDEFQPGSADRAAFGLPVGVPMLLFAGDIRSSRKNLDTVLRAMVLSPECHLAVAGRLAGSPYPELATKLGISSRVYFLDMVTQMANLMRCVDIFVFPSRYEAMSLVLLEAMASGLPVLTAKTAGGAEIVADGGRVLDNPSDAETLAAWINELTANFEVRSGMAKRAREIATRYSWGKMGEKYLAVYESV